MKECKVYGWLYIGCFLLTGCGWNVPEEIELAYEKVPEKIDFNYHVKPILSDKCFACHGPDAANQKAGLRLDIEENAFGALENNVDAHAIVPGKPGKSEAISRILSKEENLMMPPPESNLALNEREIAILTKWVAQGATYKPHWSFIKPEKERLPQINKAKWAQNEIDFFVAHKLEEQNLSRSEKASKETLIRRLSFDLIGLPPSLEQIEDFVQDTSANAYEKLVDRLLASPAYGERMATEWMDVARYAESDGYLDDKHRDFSPYRDWVIKAFNENMSYEKFTTWQLAGDLIKEPTQESILATAFNRLHKKNSEAGIVFEEFRQEYVADRTLTLGKAFLGLSVECARCHDHKYDAISQKEHYEMAAFFNSTNEIGTAVYGPGQVPGPSLLLTNEEQDRVLEYIDSNIDKVEKQLVEIEKLPSEVAIAENDTKKLLQDLQRNYKEGLVANFSFDKLRQTDRKRFSSANLVTQDKPAIVNEPDINTGASGDGIFINDYTTIQLPEKVGWYDFVDPFTVSLSLFPNEVYEEAGIFYHCEDLRLGLNGYSFYLEDNRPKFVIAQSWPTNAIQVTAKEPLPEKEWSNFVVSYDGLGKGGGVHFYVNGEEMEVTVEIDNLYKSITFEPNIHTYGFRGFTLGVRDKIKTFINGGLDELKIYNRELTALEVLYSEDKNKAISLLQRAQDTRGISIVSAHRLKNEPKFIAKNKELRNLKRERLTVVDTIPEIMVLGETPQPRPTYVLDRGMYDSPTEEVFPNIIKAVLPFAEDLPRNRLGLTKWLFDKDHPLTARVYVNRLWQMHFGKGLVASSDDFGNQGDLPSHPELLDWLAVSFRESGWDIKKMHKIIVMSATYQQSSQLREELHEIDVDNKLLARGPSFRMTAEMVRDNALAISGLLSHKIGGPSVYPYQPEGLWDEISNKSWRYKYLQEPGEGLYRRSLYTIWKRTSAPPSMLIFDVGERGVCTVKRRETSTPLQALVLLNDPQFVEASRVLAENLIENYSEVDERLQKGYQLATGREASTIEMNIVQEFYNAERNRFQAKKEDAVAYVSTGSSKPKNNLNVIEVAALSTVLNGVMNTADGYTIR